MAAALWRAILGHIRVPVAQPVAAGSKKLQSFPNLLFRPFSSHGDEHLTKEEVAERVLVVIKNFPKVDPSKGNKAGHDWASVHGYGVPSFTFSGSARLGAPHRGAVSRFFPRRCFTTAVNPVESVSDETTVPVTDLPTRIKFKRLDKTARHIMQILDKEAVKEVRAQREILDIKPGYIIQLKLEVPENKRRITTIKGIVIARRNAGLNTTFRIRRLVAGVGVESLLPLYSPNIKEIKVLDKKKVRRAKLYYLREKMNPLKK